MRNGDRRDSFPVRQVGDGDWEVLIASEDIWVQCETEKDARILSRAPKLELDALERARSGLEFAAELDALADVLERCQIGFGSRFFRRRAAEVRREAE